MDVTPNTSPEVTVLFPCLNEERTIAECVRRARAALDGAGLRGEVLVADNGSTDASVALAEEAGARVVPVRGRGYGRALRAGLAAAAGDFVVFMDADLSYDPAYVPEFAAALRGGGISSWARACAERLTPGPCPRTIGGLVPRP
ncbi:MAG TPA: glycosyltransferase family 2 protein [Candidatus Hydrogenedentes bacterium]|nr:glycosyltransferase family 2 protein [Candidatus Hydrogenedentota bacterium]